MQPKWLEEILETVREFGAASLGLVAWELSLPEEDLAPAWAHAIRTGLLRPVGGGMHAPASDEVEDTYSLASDEAVTEEWPAARFRDPDDTR